MFVRIAIRNDRDPLQWRSGHKPLSLLYSLALHGSLVALAFLPSTNSQQDQVYRSMVVELEKDHKLIYYDFHKELPKVTPTNPTGKRTTPSPEAQKAKQQIVAFPHEKSANQLVYIPEPRIQLQTELKAPNLVAIETPPEVPLPDKPKPKPFQAPEAPKPAPSKLPTLPSAPAVAENAATKDAALNALLEKPKGPPPKQFVAPPRKPNATPASPTQLADAPSVAANPANKDASLLALLDKPKGPPPKQFVAPPRKPDATPAGPTQLADAPSVTGNSIDKDPSLLALLDKPKGPPPKQFVAPSRRPNGAPAGPAQLPNAPAVGATSIDKAGSLLPLFDKPVGPPPKKFTAPQATASAGQPKTADLPSAPAVGSGGEDKSSALADLLSKPAGPPPKAFTPPPARKSGTGGTSVAAALPAAPAVASGTQPAAAVAIIGLNPANLPEIPKPEGSRPARIDMGTPAPDATRAELGGGTASISMPDVAIQGRPANVPAIASLAASERTGQPATGLARPQAPQVLPSTPHVSVPQWPTTRSLPAAVERHFQNRVVYMTSIPSAQGSDDWIIWFGELTAAPVDAHMVVHPPTLLKSGELPPFGAHSDHGTGSVRLTGVIGKDGRLQSLTELAGGPADRELVEALQSWVFGPARRNGIAFEADTVIEIPVVFGRLSLR